MKIIAKCPNCGKNIDVPQNLCGKFFCCPYCDKLIKIPNMDQQVEEIQKLGNNVAIDKNGKFYA